ncbi:heat-inducible protein [Escherichia coli]|uniref:Heat-inducible protein n=1 Tax=Escherichia coli TaxID=562 RepID=A0A376P4S6_ECOLX|nr:heat-inducible protein [Escherichia coli]
MKKVAAFVALSLLMAGCVSNDKIAVTPEQLQHHRFVLESVNGKPVTSDKNPPEISFGEKMMISGSMCNRFSGEGKLSNGELTAKGLAMTRMMCANPQLNELDNTISGNAERRCTSGSDREPVNAGDRETDINL